MRMELRLGILSADNVLEKNEYGIKRRLIYVRRRFITAKIIIALLQIIGMVRIILV